MNYNPNTNYGPTLLLEAGWKKAARVNGIDLLIDISSMEQRDSYQYTNYAVNPANGYKQKTLHSRGTVEINWSLSGDLFREDAGLLNFLLPANRGIIFPLSVMQGSDAQEIESAYLESCSFSSGGDQSVKYSLSGRGITPINDTIGWSLPPRYIPVPGWNSGNDLVRSWTLTMTNSLSPKWLNNQNLLPYYYRVSQTDYSLQITTVKTLQEYDTISLSLGSLVFITAIVTQRSTATSGKDVKSYQTEVTNVNPAAQTQTPAVNLTTNVLPDLSL
jgi:hypothetical protein